MESNIEIRARELYETARMPLSGSPHWDELNHAIPHDVTMRNKALELAREEVCERNGATLDIRHYQTL
jgi:hypothetical protein